MCTVHFGLCNVQYTVHVHCGLWSIQFELYTVYWWLFFVHCALCVVHCGLYVGGDVPDLRMCRPVVREEGDQYHH